MKIKIEKGVAPPQQTKRIGLQKSMPLDEIDTVNFYLQKLKTVFAFGEFHNHKSK